MTQSFEPEEMMAIAAARQLRNHAVCFAGPGLPSAAALLARISHAPDLVLVYDSGCIGARPSTLPLSAGDGILAENSETVVSTPEVFRYWLQSGRIDVGILSTAQIDRFANLNTTVIGSYNKPNVRLPGAGGAPEIATLSKETLIIVAQLKRSFVSRLDFITTAGFLTGGNARQDAGITGKGPTAVITDLCILRPDPISRELKVASIHPGVERATLIANTGWDLKFHPHFTATEPPTAAELQALRRLKARSAAADSHKYNQLHNEVTGNG